METDKAGIDHTLFPNRKRSAEIAQLNDPKQKKISLNVESNFGLIEYPNPASGGNIVGMDVVKIESISDSSKEPTEMNFNNEDSTALDLVDDETIETIDINSGQTAEMNPVNSMEIATEPSDKKIKIPAPPDREILNSFAVQRAGTLEEPYLVYVSPGVRKLSVNYYFLIGGELYYATKRHSMRFNDKFGPERHKITVQCSKSASFKTNPISF